MNPFEVIEKFGIPVAVAMAFGFFIWKQNKYIQDDLTKDISNRFSRLEEIIIKLIDELQKEVVKALNDNIDIPFISESTEGKALNAMYDTVEGILKTAIKKAL